MDGSSPLEFDIKCNRWKYDATTRIKWKYHHLNMNIIFASSFAILTFYRRLCLRRLHRLNVSNSFFADDELSAIFYILSRHRCITLGNDVDSSSLEFVFHFFFLVRFTFSAIFPITDSLEDWRQPLRQFGPHERDQTKSRADGECRCCCKTRDTERNHRHDRHISNTIRMGEKYFEHVLSFVCNERWASQSSVCFFFHRERIKVK